MSSDAVVTFDGLIVLAYHQGSAKQDHAEELRAILVNADFIGNGNPKPMSHIPEFVIQADNIKAITGQNAVHTYPDTNGVMWSKWYLHHTVVRFDGAKSSDEVKCATSTLRSPKFCFGSGTGLDELDKPLWNSTDSQLQRVKARVEMTGGTLEGTAPCDTTIGGVGPSFQMASTFKWTVPLDRVELEDFAGVSRVAIDLKGDVKIAVKNRPVWTGHPSKMAVHFGEYFDMTAASIKPSWSDRMKVIPHGTCPSILGGDDVFCPPTILKRKP